MCDKDITNKTVLMIYLVTNFPLLLLYFRLMLEKHSFRLQLSDFCLPAKL